MKLLCCYCLINTTESPEDTVVEFLEDFKGFGYQNLQHVAIQAGLFTDPQQLEEAVEDAANNMKKIDVILDTLQNAPKQQLIEVMRLLAIQGDMHFII